MIKIYSYKFKYATILDSDTLQKNSTRLLAEAVWVMSGRLGEAATEIAPATVWFGLNFGAVVVVDVGPPFTANVFGDGAAVAVDIVDTDRTSCSLGASLAASIGSCCCCNWLDCDGTVIGVCEAVDKFPWELLFGMFVDELVTTFVDDVE